ncbi:MAG: PrsW family glutamic-type intramembrane protease [Steroidobacteraceae bacterium]
MRALIALLPVVLFLVGLVQLDAFKLLRLRTVLLLMAAGAVAAGVGYLVNNYEYAHFRGDFADYSRWAAPWIEEGLKALVIVFLIRTRRVGLPVDAGIAGFALGTGFALIENLYYLTSRPDTALAVQVVRGFGTAIMHGGTATVLAMISVMLYEQRPHGGPLLLLPGFLAAVALHAGFNFLLVKPVLAALAMLGVLPPVIYLVFAQSERGLRNWLETDLDSKMQLLQSINAGTFLDSNAGRYLQTLRDRFRGEDLADMLCCLRLHGELALRAEGLLLLRESGAEELPLDEEVRDKLAELAALKRTIGPAGVLALRPLMMATGKDIWALTLLRR